ncbi:MAG: class I SAM-dependent DNA methyltransferase [Terriglobales bacterium]
MSSSAQPAPSGDVQQAAIEVSRILRDAKVDAALRTRALAALLLASMLDASADDHNPSLETLNARVQAVLEPLRLPPNMQHRLAEAIYLDAANFGHLPYWIPQIIAVLRCVGIASVLRGESDLFGVFYEAFLRYGFDNNALGIVLTPRHITRFCVELIGVSPQDHVIDLACGTGGFLVAAHEAMRSAASGGGVIAGRDSNPTVWTLAVLNLAFRRANHDLELGSCFDPKYQEKVAGRFTRAFLNPPFSQGAEPERDFIDATLRALAPGGRCAVVVKAGIFADEEHASWRAEFLHRHTLLGLISLPEDLFYPTSAPTSVLLAEAHVPQADNAPVLMARVWNDGFEKLKNKRVERGGCELPEVQRCFRAMLSGHPQHSPLAVTVKGVQLRNGVEWSPQEWLPQPADGGADKTRAQEEIVASILRTVAEFPDLAAAVLDDFALAWQQLPELPCNSRGVLTDYFFVLNGRSAGEKHFGDGALPYVSSSGRTNSIVRLVDEIGDECFSRGGITVTAFGQASVQPWPFCARGNGGSAVRVLLPRFRMGFPELAWFAAEINAQQWRFFYARMAIKSRLERLTVSAPPAPLPRERTTIAQKVAEFGRKLRELSCTS